MSAVIQPDPSEAAGERQPNVIDYIAEMTPRDAASFLLSLPMEEQPQVFSRVWKGDSPIARGNLCNGLDSIPEAELPRSARNHILYSHRPTEQAS